MKKKYLPAIAAIIFGVLFCLPSTIAQVTWVRTHGSGGANFQYISNQLNLVQTQDGNYVLLTDTVNANGYANLKLIKYDLVGKKLWSKVYTQSNSVTGKEMLELADGRLVIVGEKGLQDGFYWMVLTASGDFMEEHSYHVGSSWNLCNGAALSPSGNIVMTGSHYFPNTSNHELVWLEVAPTGNVNWSHHQTGPGWVGYEVAFLSDGTGVIGYDKYVTGEIGFIRFDAAGNILSDQLSTEFLGNLLDIEPAPGGGMFVSWFQNSQTNNLAKLDNSLQTLWSTNVKPTLNNYKIKNLVANPDGSCAGLVDRYNARLFRVDANGNLLWEKAAEGVQYYGPFDGDLIATSDDGLLFATSDYFFEIGVPEFRWVTKTDPNGNIIKNRIIGHIWLDTNGNCTADAAGNEGPWLNGSMNLTTVEGSSYGFAADSTGRFAFDIYPNSYQPELGTFSDGYFIPCLPFPIIQTNPYPDTLELDTFFLRPNLPNSLLQGTAFLDINQNGIQDPGDSTMACVSFDISSSYPWLNTTVITDQDGMYSLPVYQGSNYTLDLHGSLGNCTTAEPYYNITINGDLVTQNIPLHCTQPFNGSMVRGMVLLDANADCIPDNYSNLIGNWTVRLEDGAGNLVVGTTDNQGNYAIPVSPGTYTLTVIVAGSELNICNIPTTFQIAQGQCHTADAIAQLPNCPNPSVEVSVDRFRPCFYSNIQVNYCNLGADPAYDATLQLVLDPALSYSSATLPLGSQIGDTLLFNLGNLAPLQCSSFKVNAYLECNNSLVGQTHCVEATIMPGLPCAPSSPVWDGSNIELSSRCEQGQVIFTLHNTGTGNMSDPRSYIIIEDNVLLRPDEVLTYQLAANADTSIVLPAMGTTFRLETIQAPGHPSGTLSAVWEEGCGANPANNFSRGFVTQWPYGDEEPFYAVFCDESVGSFDPNIKKAFPKGLGPKHFIQNTTPLDYQILFQNTGTDTAYLVVLRDTLSPSLDPSSLRPGPSSHPYSFELQNGNVAVFTFENINLVDSTTNAEGSIGFVQFNIAQAPDNQPGTRIENSAAIYFDFNEPVITPTVFHEIPSPVYYQSSQLSLCAGSEWEGTVYTSNVTVMDTVRFGIFDSVFITNIEVMPLAASNLSATICSGESFAFSNESYSQTGVYSKIYVAQNGCDSTATLNLTVLPAMDTETAATICAGDSFAFGNESYSQTGVYSQVLAAQNGCDSTATLNLTVLPALETETVATICAGETFAFGNESYSQTGVYSQVFAAQNGCDSTATLSLTVLPALETETDATICAGETFAFGNESYSQTGMYSQVFAAQNGCDSSATLSLTVLPAASLSINGTYCNGESLVVNGTVFDANNPTGTEILVGAGINGCDSTINVFLAFLPTASSEISATICEGDTYELNGETYTSAGTFTQVFPAENNCDSTVQLTLNVLPLLALQVDTMALPGTEVFGVVVNADTVFTQSYMDENGCVERTVSVQILTATKPDGRQVKYLAISPNPTGGSFTISGSLAAASISEAKLLDAYGRTVLQLFENEWLAGEFSRKVDLQDVPSGVYFVSFATDGERRVMKLMVKER